MNSPKRESPEKGGIRERGFATQAIFIINIPHLKINQNGANYEC